MTNRFTRRLLQFVGPLLLLASQPMSVLPQISDPIRQVADIAVPVGYYRLNTDPASFAYWLRKLPLKPDTSRVQLYDGSIKRYQAANYRVLDLSIGDRDLQQCADAVIRLRSEYLYGSGHWRDIAFNFTSGDRAGFERWSLGWRPTVRDNNVTWNQTARADSTSAGLHEYLQTVFMYAGSYSLSQEMKSVRDINDVHIGDCFIQGGFPGHVVVVVDLVVDTLSGEKLILLAQGFTPAQDIHIIRNHGDDNLDPWYAVGKGDNLVTPEWTFEWSELKRFPD